MTGLDDAVCAAAEQAARATGNFRHGAVVLDGRRVLATGHNHVRRAKGLGMVSIHAEVDALWKLRGRTTTGYKSLKIVVVRVMSSGDLALSRPCDACMRALRRFPVARVVYSVPDGMVVEDIV